MIEARSTTFARIRRAWPTVHRVAYRISRALLVVRVAIVLSAIGLLIVDALNSRAHAAPMSSNERAYTWALICYVVAVDEKSDSDHARALDGVRKMAKVMGYDDKRMADDTFKRVTVLGARTRSDPEAITRNRDMCRKLGLIS